MSAAERPGDTVRRNGPPDQPPGDISRLHARRRAARRRQHLLRVDLGLGLVAALVLVLAAPGLAITGLIALIVLLVCLVTLLLERRVGWRRWGGPARRHRKDPSPGGSPDEL